MQPRKTSKKVKQPRPQNDQRFTKGGQSFKIRFDFSPRKMACFIQDSKPSYSACLKSQNSENHSNRSNSSCEISTLETLKSLRSEGEPYLGDLIGEEDLMEITSKDLSLQLKDSCDSQEWSFEEEKVVCEGAIETSQKFDHLPAKDEVTFRSYNSAMECSTTDSGSLPNTQPSATRASGCSSTYSVYKIVPELIIHDGRCTIMIKNIPSSLTFQDVVAIIDYQFTLCYDFFYMPCSNHGGRHFGHAFMNFISPVYLYAFYQRFQGTAWLVDRPHVECYLSYARLQGYDALVEDYHHRRGKWDKKGPAIYNRDFIYLNHLVMTQQMYYG